MINKKNVLALVAYMVLTACYTTRKPIIKTDPYNTISFLHEHKGTANYEVIELSSHDEEVASLTWRKYIDIDMSFGYDSISKVVIFIAETDSSSVLYRYSLQDGSMDSLNDYGRIFNNGTLSCRRGTSNWINDGNKKFHKRYIYGPLEDTADYVVDKIIPKDSMAFMRLNDSLYKKCSKSLYYYYYYYYIAPSWHVVSPLYHSKYEIRSLFPEKEGTKRIINLKHYNIPPFVKVRYIGTRNSVSKVGGIGHNFSTGIWIIKVAMPGGDTITYKRTGDAIGHLTDFYVVPKSMGGNDSILFIAQEYNNNYEPLSGTYFSHGGSYMIRPRKKSDKHIF